jgi:hypothetical protein
MASTCYAVWQLARPEGYGHAGTTVAEWTYRCVIGTDIQAGADALGDDPCRLGGVVSEIEGT